MYAFSISLIVIVDIRVIYRLTRAFTFSDIISYLFLSLLTLNIFGPKSDEIKSGRGKIHNKGFITCISLQI
jgi:hypothetical protein